MGKNPRMTALACCAGLALVGGAQAAEPDPLAERGAAQERIASKRAERALALLERPGRTFHRAVELGALEQRYRELLAEARRLDVAPKRHLLDARVATKPQLRHGARVLRERIERERRERRRERLLALRAARAGGGAAAPDQAVPAEAAGGAASGTLESIAQCESGGDPGAVNPAGYYGKYQFDLGTWQSVGGSGNPAAASEAEQDYRAQLLYERTGGSAWPVCGG